MGKRNKKKKKKKQKKQAEQQAPQAEGDEVVQTATQEEPAASTADLAGGGFSWQEWAFKHKRGLWVRWTSVGVSLFLVLYGLRSLYITMPTTSWYKRPLASVPNPVLDETMAIRVGLLVSLGVALAATYGLLYLFFRHERVSEFMIDTETEMRKVSWPSWEELKTSTVATVVAVVLLGVYLYLIDVVLSSLFEVAFFS